MKRTHDFFKSISINEITTTTQALTLNDSVGDANPVVITTDKLIAPTNAFGYELEFPSFYQTLPSVDSVLTIKESDTTNNVLRVDFLPLQNLQTTQIIDIEKDATKDGYYVQYDHNQTSGYRFKLHLLAGGGGGGVVGGTNTTYTRVQVSTNRVLSGTILEFDPIALESALSFTAATNVLLATAGGVFQLHAYIAIESPTSIPDLKLYLIKNGSTFKTFYFGLGIHSNGKVIQTATFDLLENLNINDQLQLEVSLPGLTLVKDSNFYFVLA